MELSGTITTKVRDLEKRQKADDRTWEADEKEEGGKTGEKETNGMGTIAGGGRRRQEEEDRLAAQLLWQKQEQIRKQREQQ
jgi:hypothetical protein